MGDSLKKKTLGGIIWTLIEQFSTTGVTFIFGILLARILSPSDYGTLAMLAIFTAVLGCFVNSGFGAALIRKPDLTEVDKSTAFYFNVAVAVICYLLLFAAAPFIADFYEIPVLKPIARVVGLNLIISSTCIVPRCMLTIRLDFKTQAKIAFACVICSCPAGLFMAYNGFGVWALVWQGIISSCVNVTLLHAAVRWYPSTGFSYASFRYLFGFGSKLLASGLLDTTYNNIYPLVIGKFFSAASLGFYSRAAHMADLPSGTLTGTMQRVTFPVLSSIQNEEKRLASAYRKFLRLSSFVIFPAMTGLSAVSDPLIRILLTDKWALCIPLLQVICFAKMWYPVHSINLNLLQVKGRSDLFLKLEIYKKILGVIILCCTVPRGLLAMCWGGVVSSLICLVLNTYYTGKLIGLGYWKQMQDLSPILLNCLIMWALVYGVQFLLPGLFPKLIVGAALGALYYILSNMLLRTQEWHDMLDILPFKRS